jgi:hypothetical protein
MATKQKLTLSKNEGHKHLKPYCEEAKVAAEHKTKAEDLRVKATEELRAKLDSDPETKDFTGTVVCIYGDQVYKIRVQRPASCNWREKRLKDPNHKAYLALMKEIDEKKKDAVDLEQKLAEAHPKCVEHGFVIGFLSK